MSHSSINIDNSSNDSGLNNLIYLAPGRITSFAQSAYDMSLCSINIDSHSNNSAFQSHSSTIELEHLPKNLSSAQIDHFKGLLAFLETDDEQDFLDEYTSSELLKTRNDMQVKLLAKAIEEKRSETVVDAILCNVSNLKYNEEEYGVEYLCAIGAVCKAEDFAMLKKLLSQNKPKFRMVEIIDTLIYKLEENLFEEWFDDLYDLQKFDVNEHFEKVTLIENALWFENNTAIKKLCNAGAFIGFQLECFENEKGYLIDKMDPDVLKEIFDSCITENDYSSKAQEYTINFNYRNFVRPKNFNHLDEMTPIIRILQTEELLPLLKHPLITSLLTLKWLSVSRIFYLNFLLYCFYGLSMVAYIIFKCKEFDSNSLYVQLSWYLTFLGIAYMIIREVVQFIRQPIKYLSMFCNYMEIMLITLSITIITMDFKSPDSKITAVITILLMAWDLCLLVGYLPILSISTHMLMLEEVLKTFLKSFSLYSIFVLTFALCFYVLFGTEHRERREKEAEIATNPNNCTCTEVASDAGPDYKFENVLKSIPKTMAMAVGELDFESLNFQEPFGYILFLLFVICMTVVLMNLLNGLAVSDIQTIRNQAELNELICRAKLLTYYAPKLLNKSGDCFCDCYLTVKPNATGSPNIVTFPATCSNCSPDPEADEDQDEDKEENKRNTKNPIWSRCFNDESVRHIMDSLNGKCTAMGTSIVKKAKTLVISDTKETQLECIEKKVDSMQEDLKKLLDKFSINE